ncbi:MAG TPA: sugar phosphate isomerase/epimerase [Caldilineaceae bacterium]|nr:sugar phosphate isomerase/epimerase [Caldilineaceae bacterium]
MKTRTGAFPIGFRRGGGEWQRDLQTLVQWAVENGLEVIDLGADADTTAKTALDAGLRIGSVNLPEVKGMISADRARRADAVARNSDYIRACAAHGPMNHFLVMLPEDSTLARAENFAYMVESFGELAPVLEASNARLVIEGWPGPGALCCTPEGYRAFFAQVPSPAMGINYDPSHLIRMRIDHLRFLREFGDRVFHVHGKDTEVLEESLYEYGVEQPPTFAKPRPYAGMTWRYTIPGHGQARWVEIFQALREHGYQGAVSIELEDANFHRDPEAEKLGILQGARFLTGC